MLNTQNNADWFLSAMRFIFVTASSILVNGSASIETGRGDVRGVTIGSSTDDYASAAFRRTALDPVDIVAIKRDIAEPDGSCDYQIRRDR